MRARGWWRRQAVRVAAVPLWSLAAGCATEFSHLEAGHEPGLAAQYVHRERGYRILDPAGGAGSTGGGEFGWRRVDVEGADLAFRAGDGESTMTLIAECSRPKADPMILARHLVIGVPDRDLRQAGPALVDGVRAWSQTFDAELDGVRVRVKTVTSATDACSYDWILVASGRFEGVEHEFDAWWLSFRHAPATAPPRVGDTVVGGRAGREPGE